MCTVANAYVVASDRAYFTGWHDGYPVTSPFADDAAVMSRAIANKLRDRVNDWFYGYYVRAV